MREQITCKLGLHAGTCGEGFASYRVCRRFLGRFYPPDEVPRSGGRWVLVLADHQAANRLETGLANWREQKAKNGGLAPLLAFCGEEVLRTLNRRDER